MCSGAVEMTESNHHLSLEALSLGLNPSMMLKTQTEYDGKLKDLQASFL